MWQVALLHTGRAEVKYDIKETQSGVDKPFLRWASLHAELGDKCYGNWAEVQHLAAFKDLMARRQDIVEGRELIGLGGERSVNEISVFQSVSEVWK